MLKQFMPPKFKEELLREGILDNVQQFIHTLIMIRLLNLDLLFLKNFTTSLIGGSFIEFFIAWGSFSIWQDWRMTGIRFTEASQCWRANEMVM